MFIQENQFIEFCKWCSYEYRYSAIGYDVWFNEKYHGCFLIKKKRTKWLNDDNE
jgi:hypothetical protein